MQFTAQSSPRTKLIFRLHRQSPCSHGWITSTPRIQYSTRVCHLSEQLHPHKNTHNRRGKINWIYMQTYASRWRRVHASNSRYKALQTWREFTKSKKKKEKRCIFILAPLNFSYLVARSLKGTSGQRWQKSQHEYCNEPTPSSSNQPKNGFVFRSMWQKRHFVIFWGVCVLESCKTI